MMKGLSVKKSDTPPTNELAIDTYLHCGLCIKSRPQGISPAEWSSLLVGWTSRGLQVWCSRHRVNVIHVDFHGQTHFANTTCEDPKEEPPPHPRVNGSHAE
jgi:hypothetical protein